MTIKKVKIVNFDKTTLCVDIEICNNKIRKITPVKGKATRIAIPGYIDTHIHGAIGYDCMDSINAIEQISKHLGRNGITTFLPTLITAPLKELENAIKNCTKAKSIGAKIAGIHIEGPFISPEMKGAHDPKYLLAPDPKVIERFQKIANGLIKKITYAPELKNGNKLTKKMIDLGIEPTIGHTSGNYQDAIKAINDGARTCTHIWNRMTGVANRAPGFAQAILVDDRIYPELIGDGFHVDKETIQLTIKAKGIDKVIMVTDAIRPSGLSDGESMSGGLPIIKKGIKIYLKGTNTIAGSACSMHDVFLVLIKMGYKINDVVALTSSNAAHFMKWDKIGYIKESNFADIVLLKEKTYEIDKVYINGKEQ